jgi:NTE family protein
VQQISTHARDGWWMPVVFLLALTCAAGPAVAADKVAAGATAVPPAFSASNRPRIGLVLGGGGAKGFAHIGVIEELERLHIPVDVIAGTSMGAVVGSLYATGNDAAGLERVARDIDWATVFNDRLQRGDLSIRRKREDRQILLSFRLGIKDGKPVLPTGVLGGQKLFSALQERLAAWRAIEDFDKLSIPFRAVATNIVTGDPVAMGSGNLTTAVFASMSIPAAFPPIEREGLLLVDGGISDNLPVDVARAMGVDVVIAVEVGEKLAAADQITSAITVVKQMQLLLGNEVLKRQRASLAGRDVLIEPDISGIGVADFDKLEAGIERGRAAAQAAAARLAPLAVNDVQWAAYLAARDARSHPAPIRIDHVVIANESTVETRDIAKIVTTKAGDMLDGEKMAREVANIYALYAFERVDYRIDVNGDGNTLLLNAHGLRGAGKYFQAGLMLASDFGKSANFDLAVAYTDRDFLGTGAEWRGFAQVGSSLLFDVSLYKQFGRMFFEPVAFYERRSVLLRQVGSTEQLDSLQAVRAGAGIDGGLVFGNWGELRAGARLGGVEPLEGNFGLQLGPGWHRDVEWRLGFAADTLDSQTFPRSGVLAQVQFIDHVSALGGEFTRNTLQFNLQKPFSYKRLSVVLGARGGTTLGRQGEFVGDFVLGGFLNLSGVQRNSLVGPQQLMGRAVGFYRISDRSPILDLPIYVGGSFEAGNVWQLRSDFSLSSLRTAASAFIAADTFMGPVWLAYGQSGGNSSVYLVVGRVF